MKNRIHRNIAIVMSVIMLVEVLYPLQSYALTSGPSQPEIQSFEPIGTTEMVNTFTGDFTYNIPLFELPGPYGGYPFNLHYNAGISPDQEASWVGLGWNLNVGAITRQMNGLPDEYKNAQIEKEEFAKPNKTYTLSPVGAKIEVVGVDLANQRRHAFSIYYNNYNGVGYSYGFSKSKVLNGGNSRMSYVLGGDIGFNSQEGIDVGVSLDFSLKMDHQTNGRRGKLSSGLGYNSETGLKDLTLEVSTAKNLFLAKRRQCILVQGKDVSNRFGNSGRFSLAPVSYIPSYSSATIGRHANLNISFGSEMVIPIFGALSIGGAYEFQRLKDNGRKIQVPAYGYYYSQSASDEALLDINRDQDLILRKMSPNLAVPITTPDHFTVATHGVGGTFRPFRNDYGQYFDKESKSNSMGGAVDLEFGSGGLAKFGFGIEFSMSHTRSGKWKDDNEFVPDFKSSLSLEGKQENVYFKEIGDGSLPANLMSDIHGESAVNIELEKITGEGKIKEYRATNNLLQGSAPGANLERRSRTQVMNYIDNNPSKGMSVLSSNGVLYEYSKVANNNVQVECVFATDANEDCTPWIEYPYETSGPRNGRPTVNIGGTDKYYSRTEMPPYAYCYLLEGIKGPDYIDITGNGITDDDYGYWVKFTYTDPIDMGWRSPFTGANYFDGLHTKSDDNRASYMYGRKTVYYVTQVETQTHKAVFHLSDRRDARGAAEEYGFNSSGGLNNLGAKSKRLDKISLYSKLEATAIKEVHFQYDANDMLCKGNLNHDVYSVANPRDMRVSYDKTLGGKLTLNGIYFTYGNSTRAQLSPYKFYYSDNLGQPTTAENPSYEPYENDRWGYYLNPACKLVSEPYVPQLDRIKANEYASSWSMRAIKLPTGALIRIKYEADDYAYVQDKRAMQMFKIASLSFPGTLNNQFDGNGIINHGRWDDYRSRMIYINLESPIAQTGDYNERFREQYIGDMKRVFFKVYMNLHTFDDYPKDYVSGYCDLDIPRCVLDANSIVNGNFTRGIIVLGRPKVGTRDGDSRALPYHPFSVAAWEYIRSLNPEMIYPQLDKLSEEDDSKEEMKSRVNSLVSLFSTLGTIFKGYYKYCYGKEWGTTITLDRSYIRLYSPDRVKIGGGLRVQQITIDDNWDESTDSEEEKSIYGVNYDYTIVENGNTISSGVAENEPSVGYEECALRNVKEYSESIPLKVNQNYMFEYPINESYYPAPSIGYRKITMKSLTASQTSSNNESLHLSATGASVYEFYTAKDYPVITHETSMNKEPKNFPLPIPFIGSVHINHLTATQGYSIILNDMHGKLKKVSQLKRNKDGSIDPNPISYQEFIYSSKTNTPLVYDFKTNRMKTSSISYQVLDNYLPVLIKDNSGSDVVREMRYLGQDVEFFSDFRESMSEGFSGQINPNLDLFIAGVWPAFAMSLIPGINYTHKRLRTAVTNKVIYKSGILIKTVSYMEGSSVVSENLIFDPVTGAPLLSSVTNNFGDPVFNYDYPAYYAYSGIGPAYENIGMKITLPSNTTVSAGKFTQQLIDFPHLVTGDELLNSTTSIRIKVLSIAKGIITFSTAASSVSGDFKVTRSGKRNQLSVMAGNIKTLGDKSHADVRKEVGMPSGSSIPGDPTDVRNRTDN